MVSRGHVRYIRSDTGQPISDEDIYTILMLYQYKTMSLRNIAKKYGLSSCQVRDLVGRRMSVSCCG